MGIPRKPSLAGLRELLGQAFTNDELLRLVEPLPNLSDLLDGLPATDRPHGEFVAAVVEGLERRNLIDSQLFAALLLARPNLTGQIHAVAASTNGALRQEVAVSQWLPSDRFDRAQYPFVPRPARSNGPEGDLTEDAGHLLDSLFNPGANAPEVQDPERGVRSEPCAVLIYGATGVGKSAVAEWWADLHRRDYRQILWVDAGRRPEGGLAGIVDGNVEEAAAQSLRFALVQAAIRAKMVPEIEKVGEPQDSLEVKVKSLVDLIGNILSASGRSLVIFDDLEMPSAYTGVLPHVGQIDVLITSTSDGLATCVYLDDLRDRPEVADAIVLQGQKRFKVDQRDRDAAREISRRCGWLPLGLSLVARMLRDNLQTADQLLPYIREAGAVDDLLDHSEFRPVIAAISSVCVGESDPVAKASSSALALLAQLEPGARVRRSTLAMALNDPSSEAGRQITSPPLPRAISLLIRRGLIVMPDRDYVSCHRLVAEAVRTKRGSVAGQEVVDRLLLALHVHLRPLDLARRSALLGQDTDLTSQILYLIDTHLQRWLTPGALPLNRIGENLDVCYEALRRAKRMAQYRIAVSRRRSILAQLDGRPDLRVWWARLAEVHADLLLNEVRVMDESEAGKALALAEVAAIVEQGLRDLEPPYQSEAAGRAAPVVRAHILMTAANLHIERDGAVPDALRAALGELDGARAGLDQMRGDCPLDVATVLSHWAQLKLSPVLSPDVEAFRVAVPAVEQALELYQANGGEDTDVVGTLADLCDMLTRWSRLSDVDAAARTDLVRRAVKCGSRALEVGNQRLGVSHPVTATAFTHYAHACLEAHNTTEAIKSAEQAVEVRRRYDSSKSPSFAHALMNLAFVRDQVDLRKARAGRANAKVAAKEYAQAAIILRNAASKYYPVARLDELRVRRRLGAVRRVDPREITQLWDELVTTLGPDSTYAARLRGFVEETRKEDLPIA